jgi:ParB family transcriptional regulator, chromosome partitioning protein
VTQKSTQKKVLGRGLGALIPQKEEPRGLLEVEVGRISPNPYQPRKTFDETALSELADSIREHGIVQPLIVTRSGDRYQLIAGERRFRAAQKAGLKKVPVVVKEIAGASDALQLAIIENVQREDLNPIEEAVAYQQLHDEFSMTQDEIAKHVGKERSTVANVLRLLRLPDRVKQLVAGGQLSMGHARALLGAPDAKRIESLADRVVKEGLNVRQTEQLVTAPAEIAKTKVEKPKDVFTRDAEEKLTRTLRAKVLIDRQKRGGQIRVHFNSEDELIRLYEELASGRRK